MPQPLIRMRSGVLVNALNPSIDTIRVEDVAFGLSRRMRYSSQSDLSVAQHTAMGAMYFLDRGQRRLAYEFLNHDDAEYILADVPSPVKHDPYMAGYRAIEARVEKILAVKFGCTYPMLPAVHEMDQRMLATESRDLKIDIVWDGEAPKPMSMKVEVWGREMARTRWLSLFNELCGDPSLRVPHSATVPNPEVGA